MLTDVINALKEYKGVDDLAITEETTFAELELDSLDTVELIMNLEEKFSVTIDVNQSIQTVGELVKVLEDN